MGQATSLIDLGITSAKVLKLLDQHEELSTVAGQLKFLLEYMRLASAKYGEPNQFIEIVIDDAGIAQELTKRNRRSSLSQLLALTR
jgi:hypothetical protein